MNKFKWYRINFLIRMGFLFLVPTMFRYLNFAFIWHSIFWGTTTMVVLIWGFFILITPLFGRIGCGWLCFFGTIQDLASVHSFFRIKWRRPIWWVRLIFILMFFVSAFAFFVIRHRSGIIDGWRFSPFFLSADLNLHYKHIWLYDTLGILIVGVLQEKRWTCRNTCPIGGLCAVGSSFSRLLPVVEKTKCSLCRLCDKACPVNIPITDYIEKNNGLITNSECLICGKCIDVCKPQAIRFKIIWNRKKYKPFSSMQK